MKTVKFIDLFAGIGGLRLGFEQALQSLGLIPDCLLSSEIVDILPHLSHLATLDVFEVGDSQSSR
ncbi:MAG: C-5 cytosine-specific DNA methylase, partial [Phormidium sp. OSCR]